MRRKSLAPACPADTRGSHANPGTPGALRLAGARDNGGAIPGSSEIRLDTARLGTSLASGSAG